MPPVAIDPREGVWFGAGELLVQQARDRWLVTATGATINDLAVDDTTVWLATDDGVVRFESGTQRVSRITMDDGLPSQAASTVAVDKTYVWFGTNKGLVRYRKLDRTLRLFTDAEGLPHAAVTDLLVVGRQVWIGTRGGLASYDLDTDGLRAYTTADGLGADYIEELYQVGDDLWCRTDAGLSRLRTTSRRFTNFTFADIGGESIKVFTPEGDRVWVGTEKGLSSYEAASDAFIKFPQQSALESPSIVGVELFTDYLFITTDKEVVQYHKTYRTMRRFSEADAIPREAGAIGTLLASGNVMLLFADGAALYDIQRDLWTWRPLSTPSAQLVAGAEAGDGSGASFQLWTRLDAERPYNLGDNAPPPEGRYATASGGLGAGYQFGDGRSLDLALKLDYGELELPGIRDQLVRFEYLATENDVVREVKAGDALEVRTVEQGIEQAPLLNGGHVRIASPGAEPFVSSTIDAGVRRGASVRDFLTGPRQEVYQLSQRYILPGSEKVWVDGELLTSGKDYTIIYPAGQLAFLDPERVDDLSIIEVEYERDALPRKGLGVISLLDLLPADNEVGAWTRAGEPTVISEESGLYAQIDGAAPKYIDRGWVRSVYTEYRQGGRVIQVAIHDMGTTEQAQEIFDYDLPPAREAVGDRENLVLDIGLATSWAVKGVEENFYIELAIDDKSDPAKQSIKLFALQVLDRGDNAGEHPADTIAEMLLAARAAVSPAAGWEVGARAIQLADTEWREPEPATDPSAGSDPLASRDSRQLLTGILDSRYERSLGDTGRLTAYGEAAASHPQNGGEDGFAGLGSLRLSQPFVDASLSARYHGDGFTPLGSNATLLGTLRDETRLNATAYPTRWLPLSVFFTRQDSNVEGIDEAGVVQHATARLQLAHPSAPAASLQVGHSLIDDAAGERTTRLKLVGQAEYDLAEGILKPLGMRRFSLSGLYSWADAGTTEAGNFGGASRVEVSRFEAKLAPTSTETAYALFRSRVTRAQELEAEPLATTARHWELNAGIRSAIIPGLIPQVSQVVVFDRGLDDSGVMAAGASSSVSAQLGVFPGDWWSALTPFAMDSRYTIGNEERIQGEFRTLAQRVDRFDNRLTYNGMDKLELSLNQIYEVARGGDSQARERQRLELRNRVVVRPVHTSPITLRFDYVRAHQRNGIGLPPASVPANTPDWGDAATYEGSVEWLSRWLAGRFTTKLKGTYNFADTRDLLVVSSSTTGPTTATTQTCRQQQVRPELELRWLWQREEGSFFLVQRSQVGRLFGDGTGAVTAWQYGASLGVIWSEADNLYLDGEVAYRKTECIVADETCSNRMELVPRLLLTLKV